MTYVTPVTPATFRPVWHYMGVYIVLFWDIVCGRVFSDGWSQQLSFLAKHKIADYYYERIPGYSIRLAGGTGTFLYIIDDTLG